MYIASMLLFVNRKYIFLLVFLNWLFCKNGADSGNRTRLTWVEAKHITSMLYPHKYYIVLFLRETSKIPSHVWEGEDKIIR